MDSELLGKVKTHCRELLNKSRCKLLQFHNYQHTLDVVQNAKTISSEVGLNLEHTELVIIAAYFHDVGNMEESSQHEMLSCSIARKFLEKEKYPSEKIQLIEDIILATEINRIPANLLEQIICDADLAHLGKKSFLVQNKRLREEWSNFLNLTFSDKEWLELNLKFLNNHSFYTNAAKDMYQEQKLKNINSLNEMF